MMRRLYYGALVLCVAGITGCGGTASNATRSEQGSAAEGATGQGSVAPRFPADGPQAAVAEFLEAVRTGEDQKVVGLFTSTARQQAAALNRQFAPRGSDTASFQVGDVEHQDNDQARVKCLWTDLDQDGKPRTDEITWLMRREPEGWRISGMAAVVFDGEPALVLDFENLEETLRRIDTLAEEIERRQMAANQPPKEGPPEGASGPGVLR